MPTSARQSVLLFEKIFGEFAAVKQADDSVRPQNARLFSEILGEFVTSQQADVGIGPYKVSANPYNSQIPTAKLIYRSYSNATICKFSCPVTGGAYHSARKVTMCDCND